MRNLKPLPGGSTVKGVNLTNPQWDWLEDAFQQTGRSRSELIRLGLTLLQREVEANGFNGQLFNDS
jgi:Spy/CpxP family protein refolding chaperone